MKLTARQIKRRLRQVRKIKLKMCALHDELRVTPPGYRNPVRRKINELKEQLDLLTIEIRCAAEFIQISHPVITKMNKVLRSSNGN